MISKRDIDILEQTIKREEEAHQHFSTTSKQLRNPSLASLFESLGEEELEHMKLLELQLENIRSGTEKPDEVPVKGEAKEHDDIQVARRAVKLFSDKAEELWKKQLSFQQEMEIAGEIQANLLPRSMPEVDDLEIAATFLMSRKVGGDYFDFYLNNKKQLFFVIGDVMGKGVPAALLMTSLRVLWRNGALQNLSPRKIVERINEGSVEDFRVNGSFATLFSACYVPVKSSLWFCNAGHDPPFYLQKGRNESLSLTTPGMVVGINPHAAYQQKVQKMSPGDLILFFSDGLWEVTDPEKEGLYNRDKVSKLLLEHREKPAEEILALLLSQMKGLSGSIPQRDDVTLILMKKR
ncbi:MAG: PP2C family protein-serine/threonine phosphatase [Candidatus Eremiobacteraeota bacterium]|nr:PP2C family protein-serine/threonine phosphatase [Candidatus Eremiobacteraeota bacterium]